MTVSFQNIIETETRPFVKHVSTYTFKSVKVFNLSNPEYILGNRALSTLAQDDASFQKVLAIDKVKSEDLFHLNHARG